MRTHLSHGSSGGGDMLLGEPKRACHRERATESVPPRACHLERSAPPSAAGVGCGWCSGAVIEQQAPARHAECTRDASRVHALLVHAAPNSVRQRRERSPCRLVHACDSSSGSARVLAHIRSAHSAWAARLTVGESSCERHHVEPRRRFLPWPPRLVSATRWGAAEAEACASRARVQQAAWEGAHTPRRPRRSEASRQVIHG